mgnify:CR=1 FL=1
MMGKIYEASHLFERLATRLEIVADAIANVLKSARENRKN